MVTKNILITFADPKIRATDHFHDIQRAADFARFNLFSKHKVELHVPILREYGGVEVRIDIPDEKADAFSIGNHLRGIGAYLLKHCSYDYSAHRVGTRLLNYTEIQNRKTVRGRPKIENPKSKQYRIRFNEQDFADLALASEQLSIPMSEVIREALQLYYDIKGI